MGAVIEVAGLEKTFTVLRKVSRVRRERTKVHAVAGVDFTIDAGEMVGYIGPNGAGKSTTIKMLTGILVPSGGTIRVIGLDPSRRRVEVARRIGVVFGQRTQLWWDLPLRDSFELLRHVYRVDGQRHAANLADFIDLLDMSEFLDTPVRQLSLGQRMRGELTAALLHDPEIVYLDEPTIGLDVVSKAQVREFLARVNRERGTTVLLTTHDLADIERLCRRVMIIDHGRVLYDGDLETIKQRFGTERTLVVDLAEDVDGPLDVPFTREVRSDGPRRWLLFNRLEITAAELIAEVAARYPMHDLTIEEPDIETIVRHIYEHGIDPIQHEAAV
jgi:ABC-2 type transport system ATP-binding protein